MYLNEYFLLLSAVPIIIAFLLISSHCDDNKYGSIVINYNYYVLIGVYCMQ